MRKLLITLWIILLLSICFNACFKTKTILIDQESKDYCLFDQGSYWIYQDSATQAIDSVVVGSQIDRRIWDEGRFNCEAYLFSIVFHYQDATSRSQRFLSSKFYEDSKLTGILEDRGHINFYYHSGKVKEYFHLYGNTQIRLLFLMDKNQYFINEITFNNIKIFEFSVPVKKEIYYWAKHVGLIREEKYDENDNLISVKNLIRYNVKPYKQ